MEATIHRAGVSWSGGEGEDVQAHDVLLGAQTLPSSSAMELGGDGFLSLARKKGFEIASYEDDADGVLDGKRFTSATLRPRVRWADDPPEPEAIEALHQRSHQLCFISNSVDFPVAVEPS
jgi:hypothetical protein